MEDSVNPLASQQAPVSQPTTGNPQAMPQVNPQSLAPQSSFLQNAGSQTVEGLNMLDQGSQALQTEAAQSAMALSDNSPSATVPLNSPVTPYSAKNVWLYGGIGLVAVLCLAVLAYGLLRPHHNSYKRK